MSNRLPYNVCADSLCRIGLEDDSPDLTTPSYTGGLGPVARGVYERISMIQQGDIEGHEWTVECL
jgi:branched-chain amino acid aminotransferase